MEDLRVGGEFVTTRHQVTEAQTVTGNCSRVRREAAPNVKMSLIGTLLKVRYIWRLMIIINNQK